MPKISILTISFNQREWLQQNIASVAAQDFEDWEQIILDPGSTDGSREFLDNVKDPRVRVITEPDSGPADGLNRGVERATGDIIYYLNSDDELAPGALARLARRHQQYPHAEILIGNGWLIDGAGEAIRYVRSDRYSPYAYAAGVGVVLQQATSFKRSVFDRGLRFNSENFINWDSELLRDAWSMGIRPRNIDDIVGYFRMHDGSLTVSGRRAELYKREVRRLRRSAVRSPLAYGLLRGLELPARAVKRMSRSLHDKRVASFPGLAR